jgi:hypothetical protein
MEGAETGEGEMTHTPKPWKIEPVFIAQQSGGALHFGEYRFPLQSQDGHCKTYPRDEAEANARLMEAAPDLLAALKAINGLFSWDLGLPPDSELPPAGKAAWKLMRDTIAKAEFGK